ncbi:NAD-dependent epimerase/dehydratase family protein [Humibacter ginsengisoli]
MSQSVLITGGAGFIGTRLTRKFVDAGYDVTILDALIPQVHGEDAERTSSLFGSVADIADVIRGSVTDAEAIARAVEGNSIVVHLAAETGTGQSMYEIDRYVEANVGGTGKLLDFLTNHDSEVRRLVVASSRSIYGEGAYKRANGQIVYPPPRAEVDLSAGIFEVRDSETGEPLTPVPTPESAKLHPSSVYGITKQMQESLVMTVAPGIGIEPVSLRYQNVYGPGQSLKNPYTGILSIFSTLITQGREINIFEDGKESRDFVYIDDVVDATFLAAVHPDAAGHIFNVGSGIATTVDDVVSALFAAFGKQVPTRVSGNYRIGDIRYNVADTERLRKRLGFAPRVDFGDGVRRFVEWVQTESVEDSGYERSLKEMSERNLLK